MMAIYDPPTKASQPADDLGGRILAFGAKPVALPELALACGVYWLAAYGYIRRSNNQVELTDEGRQWLEGRPAICVDCLDHVRYCPRGFVRCRSCEAQR